MKAVISESANGREIMLLCAETFEVRLEERPTTGFRWQIVSDGTPACGLVSDSFAPPSDSAPGRPGCHSWVFRAQRPGRATIELVSQRSWEQQGPAKIFRIKVIVVE